MKYMPDAQVLKLRYFVFLITRMREPGEPTRKRRVYLRDTVFSLHFN